MVGNNTVKKILNQPYIKSFPIAIGINTKDTTKIFITLVIIIEKNNCDLYLSIKELATYRSNPQLKTPQSEIHTNCIIEHTANSNPATTRSRPTFFISSSFKIILFVEKSRILTRLFFIWQINHKMQAHHTVKDRPQLSEKWLHHKPVLFLSALVETQLISLNLNHGLHIHMDIGS